MGLVLAEDGKVVGALSNRYGEVSHVTYRGNSHRKEQVMWWKPQASKASFVDQPFPEYPHTRVLRCAL